MDNQNTFQAKASIARSKILWVIIKRPDRMEFSGNAKAVTSINMRGLFDVLPFHSNFISLIKDQVTIHLEEREPLIFKLQSGILKVTGNTVTVLIGIETHG